MRNYVNRGERITCPSAPYAVASGGGFQVGSIVQIALQPAAAGAPVEGLVRGQSDVAKATGQAWTYGQKLYWDNTAKNFTTTVGSNQLVGWATQNQAAADVVGRAYLDGIVR